MNRYLALLIFTIVGLLSAIGVHAQTATLLPNAIQYFMDNNGKPLSNGKVFFYVPPGTTPKTVWSDPGETTPITQPVLLGTSGRPAVPIYGDGVYRQVVKDQFNNVIWDFNTASTGGGTGGGTASSQGVMVGTIIPWVNTTLPPLYLYTAGQAVSRTTYAQLLTAITFQTTILCQNTIATISVSTDISDKVPIGAPIEASCFVPGTTVSAKSSGSLTLSNAATTTASVAAVIFPWGNGNGATTFNVPDLRGRVMPGRNNMGGTAAGTLVSTVYGSDPNAVNALGGSSSTSMGLNQLPQGITVNGTVNVQTTSSLVVFGGIANTVTAPSGAVGIFGGSSQGPLVSTGVNTLTTNNTGKGRASSATVGAGGSGYTAGTQLLTVTGGTCTTNPQFSVTIVAGAITAPVLVTAGQCTAVAANPAATTGGGGTGGTLNVTYIPLPLGTIPPSTTADYIIKALPDDLPSGPGVTSIGGMTGVIACGLGVVCTANTINTSFAGSVSLVPLFSTGAATAPAFRAIVGSDLPNPSTTTLGGVFSLPVTSNSVLSGIDNTGTPTRATTTGTGDVVRGTGSTLSGPIVTGGMAFSGDFVETQQSSTAFVVGRQGILNPALQIDTFAAAGTTGGKFTAQAAGNGFNFEVTSSAANEPFIVNAKGSGSMNFGTNSTGPISFFRNSFINHDSNPTLTLGSVGGSLAHLTTPGTSGLALTTNTSVDQVLVTHTASANRRVTLTGSNGGNPTISTDGGSLGVGVALVGAAAVDGTMAATTIKCNTTGGTALSTDCTASQVRTLTEQNGTLLAVLTASSSATLSDTTHFTSSFDDYMITFNNLVPVTDSVGFVCQIHSGGSFQTTSYLNAAGGVTTGIDLTSGSSTVSNTAGIGVSGTMYLRNINSTSVNKFMDGRMYARIAAGGITANNSAGYWAGGQGAVDGLQCFFTSGNISTGNIKISGLRSAL